MMASRMSDHTTRLATTSMGEKALRAWKYSGKRPHSR
jgi:hypothetical protein